MDVHIISSATSAVTIEKIRGSFATLGLREIMVADNGPGFTSMEFAQFILKNGIWLVTTAPYHPASNGLAERAVQTVKEGLRKMVDGSLGTQLSSILHVPLSNLTPFYNWSISSRTDGGEKIALTFGFTTATSRNESLEKPIKI